MKCRICGAEKATRRSMHGHCMTCHYEDYKRLDFMLERIAEDVPPLVKDVKKEIKKLPRPDGFRLLRRSNEEEAVAIDQGFDFIDNENYVYTAQEARAEGWI